MEPLIFIFGFIFGLILQYANLNKYNTISGVAMLKDFTVPKAILVALAVGTILVNLEVMMGLVNYEIKPLVVGGLIIGGILFGIGMATLGYCPGTLPISAGQGAIDAWIGILGGLTAGIIYTIYFPYFQDFLGPNLGKINLYNIISNKNLFMLFTLILSILYFLFAFWINSKEGSKNYRWLIAGILIGILNPLFILVVSSPIGASATYPYLSAEICSLTLADLSNNTYFQKIMAPGYRELIFLIGAFLSGLIVSLLTRQFKPVLIHENWKNYRGTSKIERIIWSFIGGFLLILGARMAGGCTSGHIISGIMQLAISGFIFGIFVFASLLITGYLFYRRKSN